jgi:hypothetical protein
MELAELNGTEVSEFRPYVPGEPSSTPTNPDYYNCKHFARDFEFAMELYEEYEVTVTLIRYYTWPDCTESYAGHAMNDFHDEFGRVGFFEPQLNEIVDLDLNGDGIISLSGTGQVFEGATEIGDGKCIAIDTFDSIEDATDEYGGWDPWAP